MYVDVRCLICVNVQIFLGNKVEIYKQRHVRIYNAHESGAGGVCLSVLRILCITDYFIKYTEFFAIDIIS